MNSVTNYVIRTDIKFGAMEKIDIDVLQKACPHDWFKKVFWTRKVPWVDGVR
jgi:hypothetical protein